MPYIVISGTTILVFNIVPIVFLCVYPSKAFQNLLGKPRFGKVALAIHPFADAFQGCYKSGTDGKRDYRYFAGLYLMLRFITCFLYMVGSKLVIWLSTSFLFLIAALLFANMRPYRNDIFNTIDSLWFALGMIFTMCQALIVARGVGVTLHYQIILQVLLGIPLVYIICYMVYSQVATLVSRRARRLHVSVSPTTAVSRQVGLPYRLLEENI